MYFCPCSCSESEGDKEEDVLICLPRNLSYASESYLDRYSVSSAFVHNSKVEKELLQADREERLKTAGETVCVDSLRQEEETEGRGAAQDTDPLLSAGAGFSAMADPCLCTDDPARAAYKNGSQNCDVTVEATMALPPSSSTATSATAVPNAFFSPLTVNIDRRENGSGPQSDFDRYVVKTAESPDSDLVSEEGIFVNMMDDLDVLGGVSGKCTLSEASDDTYVSGDSMYYSPVEVEEVEDEQLRGEFRVTLEEAVQQAADSMKPVIPLLPDHHHNSPHNGVSHHNDLQPHSALASDVQAENGDESKTEVCDRQKDKTDTETTSGKEESGTRSNQGSETDVESAEISVKAADSGAVETTSESKSGSRMKSAGADLCKVAGTLEITINDRPFKYDEKRQLSSSYRDLVSPESPVYEDREFNFTRSELRKSTSLKSSKTPPGTPRRKKVVRFADALGLDLESVRHVLNLDSPPKIPPSAMKDLQTGLGEDRKEMGTKFITETFPQPGAALNFRDRVLAEKVVLENALVVSGSITGVIRVANIAFHKTVRVRFTTNGWTSFHDIAASYMQNSNDGGTDRFSFTLVPPPDFSPGSRLEFAISYTANGVDHWDNNIGENYGFECYAKTIPTEAENAWIHFL